MVVPSNFEYIVGACDLELACIVPNGLAVVVFLPGNLLVVIPCRIVVVDDDSTVVKVASGKLVFVLPPNNFVVDDGGCAFVADFPDVSGVGLDIVANPDLAAVAVVTDKLTVVDVLDVMFFMGGGCVVRIAGVPTALVEAVVSSDVVETVPASYIDHKCLVICTKSFVKRFFFFSLHLYFHYIDRLASRSKENTGLPCGRSQVQIPSVRTNT